MDCPSAIPVKLRLPPTLLERVPVGANADSAYTDFFERNIIFDPAELRRCTFLRWSHLPSLPPPPPPPLPFFPPLPSPSFPFDPPPSPSRYHPYPPTLFSHPPSPCSPPPITVLALEVRLTDYRDLVTEFEYRPRDGVLILWHVTVSGYHESTTSTVNATALDKS